MEQNKEVKITEANLDKDVLDIMKSENILATIESENKINRLLINLFGEFLSEQKKETDLLSELSRTLTMISKDKLADFYNGVGKGFAEEKKRADVKKIIEKGHKKPKNNAKK